MEKKKVIFVEDDAFLSQIFTKALDLAGYDVISVSSGEECLKIAEREKPDLFLLDIILPHMDGYELMEELQKNENLRQLPILVITNLSNKEDVDKTKAMGVAGYLIKAHTLPEDVVAKIQSILN